MSVATRAESTTARWQDEVYEQLRQNNITQIAYVPDAVTAS
jgi:hypothetical protein